MLSNEALDEILRAYHAGEAPPPRRRRKKRCDAGVRRGPRGGEAARARHVESIGRDLLRGVRRVLGAEAAEKMVAIINETDETENARTKEADQCLPTKIS